jgi:hypothetical protein
MVSVLSSWVLTKNYWVLIKASTTEQVSLHFIMAVLEALPVSGLLKNLVLNWKISKNSWKNM